MKRLKRVGVIVIGLYVLINAMLYFLQEKLIFLPTKLPSEYEYQFDQPFEELFVETEDGARLNGLHFKSENPKGIILYFHGNAGDLSRWGNIASFFVEYQYDVLVMDYRTYGKSTGKLSEKALYNDAQLFYERALKLFDEKDIIVYGRSLGTTFATSVASNNNPRQLLLETPFYSLQQVASHHYSFLPIKWLLKYQFPTYQLAAKVPCKITIFHGTADGVVPYSSGLKLFETISEQNSQLITIEGGDHNNLIEFPKYHEVIRQTL